jgi:hypothetical protein
MIPALAGAFTLALAFTIAVPVWAWLTRDGRHARPRRPLIPAW